MNKDLLNFELQLENEAQADLIKRQAAEIKHLKTENILNIVTLLIGVCIVLFAWNFVIEQEKKLSRQNQILNTKKL